MLPKRFQDTKTGFHLLSSLRAKKYLNKIGLEREDYDFLKQVGKAMLFSYSILGALWLYNGTSPLEWLKQNSRLKEELKLAHLYPGDEESMKEFITKAKGRMIGTTSGLKGMVECDDDKDANECQKEQQSKKVDEEAQKLWLTMRNEVIAELRKKGVDVE